MDSLHNIQSTIGTTGTVFYHTAGILSEYLVMFNIIFISKTETIVRNNDFLLFSDFLGIHKDCIINWAMNFQELLKSSCVIFTLIPIVWTLQSERLI